MRQAWSSVREEIPDRYGFMSFVPFRSGSWEKINENSVNEETVTAWRATCGSQYTSRHFL
jgi:hypothetical protein